MSRLRARPRLLEVDPDCLRWTPVIVTNTVVSDDGEEDDDEEEEEEEDAEKENNKEASLPLLYNKKWCQDCSYYQVLLRDVPIAHTTRGSTLTKHKQPNLQELVEVNNFTVCVIHPY